MSAAPQLTVRAVVTGVVLGALLAPSNIYAGLKIGWCFNMSITAALLSYGWWQGLGRIAPLRPFHVLENNINQTTASSGAMIASSGLVAAVPALTLLTGYSWTWGGLFAWTLAVSLLGVGVALVLRRQMLVVENLPFPSGFATGQMLRDIHARGSEALRRVIALLAGALFGGGMKVAAQRWGWSAVSLPGGYAPSVGSALAGAGVSRVTLGNLTFALDPSPLMVAVGIIIGPRAGVSLLLGAVVAWGWIGPWALAQGWIDAQRLNAAEGASWFGVMVEWLLWPGVAMMVAAALTSVALSWRTVARAFKRAAPEMPHDHQDSEEDDPWGGIPPRVLGLLLLASGLFAVVMQVLLFEIAAWMAVVAVLLTFVLALVAARVTGETDITPIGAMGKVTQLFFGVLAPGGVTTNLMAANVTGGAASQCADLLQDLKSGRMVGAAPRAQAIAQVFGVTAGALAGSAAYLVLVPDPETMLFTDEWAAPAVATWKAVAEVLAHGVSAMPPGSVAGLAVGALVGALLTVFERRLPSRWGRWVPSPASMGLAMVIPAFYALSMFAGAVLGSLLQRLASSWSRRFLLVLAAGVIAGESIVGVVVATLDAFGAMFS